ncbi:Lon protease family protein [Vibrio tubiashii]|uniref:AAA family ATPase n=1 Tax=Vibrio tubiashii TaxID=29498 RepID=UPI001EFE6C3C|nr:Lon protease family protein [Vibrio tubiashii]MCG9582596.1 Lon protease family protein [Vibrio tubiashii]MCG9616187.1 Lon protease family protein [Vibrio tubiashii]MCG9687880.1 Lon protease family protein [Vibrio tubiashii]
MNQESWHAVTPQYSQFDAQIQRFNELDNVDFFDIQPRLKQSLETLSAIKGFSRLLIINSTDNSFYRDLIKDGLKKFIGQKPVATTESLNIATLLGSYTCDDKGDIVTSNHGLLEQADGGYLVIPATLLLANPASWQTLKSVLLGQAVSPVNANPHKIATCPPAKTYDIKIVLVGDRHQIADFEYLEPELYTGLAMFTEIEDEFAVSSQTIEQYLGFLAWLIKKYELPTISFGAIHRLMNAGARYTEDQNYMPIEVLWYLSLFQESLLTSNNKVLSEQDLEQALDAKYHREGYLPERALSDITDGQVIIETQGECIGQVNGLTVIDVPGHPMSYGEPARISCVIHFGDGDISDVERKAELGGNLHAKGMMIMQAFVSSALQLDEPLPYSASVVFEQSYSEVDGDSATLAELCSFVSALSEYPINQQIAVTGAVDQFGRVQAVGGLNEKIEGFYHVCKHQGLTGEQGVVLPKSNLKHLSLNKDVVESIKKDEFHIWSVSTVDEAIPIIMGKPFRGEDEESVISKIAQRIENFERHEHPQGIVERIKNWFV